MVLIVENSDDNTAGCGYHMATVSADFAANATAWFSREAATGYYSFGHELGHNMGARHDCYADDGPRPMNNAHGFVNPLAGCRTIMALMMNAPKSMALIASGYNIFQIRIRPMGERR
jgi:hypothetical protein